MSYLKRLTVSLRSQVEQIVNQVEDHEAVVDAAITDAKKTLAKAKTRIGHVNRDGRNLQEQIDKQQQTQLKWRNRAKQVAESADLVIFVADASRPETWDPTVHFKELTADIHVMNKIDKALTPQVESGFLPVSIKQEQGLDVLIDQMAQKLGDVDLSDEYSPIVKFVIHNYGKYWMAITNGTLKPFYSEQEDFMKVIRGEEPATFEVVKGWL